MLDVIRGFAEQVVEYSTVFGQLWYLCVFLFRGIVVFTIGGDVYNDEQSAFKCSTKIIGCENICFTNFSKISHIRFWAFQILAVSTPTILFHFFVVGVKTRIEKSRTRLAGHNQVETEFENMRLLHSTRLPSNKAETRLDRVYTRNFYDATSNTLKKVAITDGIYVAYFINVVFRILLEGLFLYLAYDLFKFLDRTRDPFEYGAMDFVWFHVPGLYMCQGPDVTISCDQHVVFSQGGYVPCWVSRPWEKTIFLRYMNVLSCLCFTLSAAELVLLVVRAASAARRRIQSKRTLDVTCSSQETELSTLAVPVRLRDLPKFHVAQGDVPDSLADENGFV